MRRQHYLNPVGGDRFDAWDVHRLVALARSLPVFDLPLADIAELDEDVWFHHGDAPTLRAVASHARLIAEADPAFPILLTAEGRVMDGRHRIARVLIEGRATIRAVRFPVTPPPDHFAIRVEDLPG